MRAGFLKCAIDEPGLTPDVERVFRAVAAAHHATGAPITFHTHPGTRRGEDVQRVLVAEEGVDPGRIVLGHSGDTTDADHLSGLAEAGFVLGMDRFGIHLGITFEERCDVVVELCRRGFAERMVLSHDAACYLDWLEPGTLEFMPQWNYLHIGRDVLPYLRDHGVTEDQIATMLVGTPRGTFEGPPAEAGAQTAQAPSSQEAPGSVPGARSMRAGSGWASDQARSRAPRITSGSWAPEIP